MLRFGCKVPLVASGCLARFQSSNADVQRSRPRRRMMPTWQLPRFEIHDVRDEAENGSMTRVAIDGKLLLISQFPQLGPRKHDPNDLSPQFDIERRVSVRLRHMDLASFVGVVEGRVASHHMKNNAYDLVFSKTSEGYSLKGKAFRQGDAAMEAWAVDFNGQFAVSMEHFLQNSLTGSFGFSAYHDEIRRNRAREQSGGADNSNSFYNNNRRGENRDRSQNRRQRRDSQQPAEHSDTIQ